MSFLTLYLAKKTKNKKQKKNKNKKEQKRKNKNNQLNYNTSSTLSWCHVISTDIPDPFLINTVPQPPYCPDLAPCDFCLFPKLTGCRYETIEEMKEAVMKVIDTLTQEDFHGAFQRLRERYNKCLAAGGDYFEGD